MKAIALGNNTFEIMITILLALVLVLVYSCSPILVTVGILALTIVVPIFLKKPEYAVLFLVAILPFRDIHLVSAIHFKRFVIWGLLVYVSIRQLTSAQTSSSPNFRRFNRIVLFFIGMIVVSLIKTASQLYTTLAITPSMLKSTILSDALFAVEGILLVYLVYYLLATLWQIERLLDIIIVVSGVIALLGIWQYYTGGPPAPLSFLFDPEYRFYGRATSVFSNPNGLGAFLAPMVAITFAALVCQKMSFKKRMFFMLPIFLLDLWGVILSFSRGAALQIFFCILLSGYIYFIKIGKKRLSGKMILIALSFVGCVLIAVQYYDLYLQARLSSYQAKDYYAALNWIKTTSDFQRKHAALQAIQSFLKHPILGIGYNVFSGRSVAGFEYFGLATHNQYLKVLVEMGLLGIIPFLGLLGVVIYTGMKIWGDARKQPVAQEIQIMMLLLLTGAGSVTFGFLFADALPIISITGYLWIFSGAIFVLARECDVNKITDERTP